MPSLNTVSTFSMSVIFAAGSAWMSTKSGAFPGAIVPMLSSRPMNLAPFWVAMWIASTGVKPASTRSSSSRQSAKPGKVPPLPVGSGPASSNPPAFTKAYSNSISFLISAVVRVLASGVMRERAVRKLSRCVTLMASSARGFGGEFTTGYVHVRFKRRSALLRPEVHPAPRVGGVLELMHLGEDRPCTFKVRCGGVYVRARHLAGFDLALHLEVREAFDVAGRAQRRDPGCQVESRRSVGNLGDQKPRRQNLAVFVAIKKGCVVEVIMHAHQPGNYGVAVHVESLGISGWLRGGSRTGGLYLSSSNDDGLIVKCRRTCDVNQFYVRKCDGRRAY